jgi:hypothetical protein
MRDKIRSITLEPQEVLKQAQTSTNWRPLAQVPSENQESKKVKPKFDILIRNLDR